jgi:DNA-nicking Smr family endonuclease
MKKESDKNNNNNNNKDEDEQLWQVVTQDVKPLANKEMQEQSLREEPESASRATASKNKSQADMMAEQLSVKHEHVIAHSHKPQPPEKTDHNLHDKAGVDRKAFEKFRKGQMPIEATLDLHGLFQQQAYEKVVQFIAQASARHMRCVMIITGKGQKKSDGLVREEGVLKKSLPDWLEHPSLKCKILKIQQAQRFHGGSGACYILLKR